jgi:hypothetical protein
MKIYYIVNQKFNPIDKIVFQEPVIEDSLEIEVINDSPYDDEEDQEVPVVDVPEGEEASPLEKRIRYIS